MVTIFSALFLSNALRIIFSSWASESFGKGFVVIVVLLSAGLHPVINLIMPYKCLNSKCFSQVCRGIGAALHMDKTQRRDRGGYYALVIIPQETAHPYIGFAAKAGI